MTGIRWALSVDDWRTHAIDERAEHPSGVYRAECGHVLMPITTLRERSFGLRCERCAMLQLDVVQTALDHAAATLRAAEERDFTTRPAGRSGSGCGVELPRRYLPRPYRDRPRGAKRYPVGR